LELNVRDFFAKLSPGTVIGYLKDHGWPCIETRDHVFFSYPRGGNYPAIRIPKVEFCDSFSNVYVTTKLKLALDAISFHENRSLAEVYFSMLDSKAKSEIFSSVSDKLTVLMAQPTFFTPEPGAPEMKKVFKIQLTAEFSSEEEAKAWMTNNKGSWGGEVIAAVPLGELSVIEEWKGGVSC